MTKPSGNDERTVEQFEILLKDSLQLGPGDDLLVIFDEEFFSFLPPLISSVRKVKISPAFLYFPRSLQQDLVAQCKANSPIEGFPNALLAAVSDSTAILNVLDGDIRTAAIRRAILNFNRPESCRFAHVPGLSKDVLSVLQSSPLNRILELCDITAWALGEAQHVSLQTQDRAGTSFILEMELEGWDNDPMMSPGVIFPGSWGNVPPGETFCCPEPHSVNGRICVNGSIPGVPFRGEEMVVLTFEDGKLTHWTTGPNSSSGAFFQERQMHAQITDDPNWNMLAELGIGLNPVITSLTGNSLFDEKAYGTIHVAIGDNSCFGHNLRSHVHLDLVCLNPSLFTDAFPIIVRGEIATKQIELARAARGREIPFVPSASRFALCSDKAAVLNGRLLRRLHKAGRVGYVSIADDSTTRELAVFWDTVIALGAARADQIMDDVPFQLSLPPGQALNLLAHYNMLKWEGGSIYGVSSYNQGGAWI
jgi:thermophilic metalloprotease (M29)